MRRFSTLCALLAATGFGGVSRAATTPTPPPSVSINLYYGRSQAIDKNAMPFACTPNVIAAVELSTHIPQDLANQIATTYFDPVVGASTTYHNVYFWAGAPYFTDDQVLHNPQYLNADMGIQQDFFTLLCRCPNKAQVFDTGPMYRETDSYTLANGGVVKVNFFERDYTRICSP